MSAHVLQLVSIFLQHRCWDGGRQAAMDVGNQLWSYLLGWAVAGHFRASERAEVAEA